MISATAAGSMISSCQMRMIAITKEMATKKMRVRLMGPIQLNKILLCLILRAAGVSVNRFGCMAVERCSRRLSQPPIIGPFKEGLAFHRSSHAAQRTTMDGNDDIRRIRQILIREICVNLCPIFEGGWQTNLFD